MAQGDHEAKERPRHIFIAEDWVPYPVETIFAFFVQPKNLPPLMPAWQKTRIDAITLMPPSAGSEGSVSGAAGVGSEIIISFRPAPLSPLRLSWLARIDAFVWNDHFCDYQVRGPFAYWRHCHRVAPESRAGDSGTHITDEVRYTLPLGPLDPLADAAFVRIQMNALFAFRRKRLRELLSEA